MEHIYENNLILCPAHYNGASSLYHFYVYEDVYDKERDKIVRILIGMFACEKNESEEIRYMPKLLKQPFDKLSDDNRSIIVDWIQKELRLFGFYN